MSSASHQMDPDDKPADRDRDPSDGAGGGSTLALFVVAELLCTGVILAWVLL